MKEKNRKNNSISYEHGTYELLLLWNSDVCMSMVIVLSSVNQNIFLSSDVAENNILSIPVLFGK
jgi:hypothetical protein